MSCGKLAAIIKLIVCDLGEKFWERMRDRIIDPVPLTRTKCTNITTHSHQTSRDILHDFSRLFVFLQIINGEWNVAAVAHKARDLERKVVGTLGSGRIGQEMAKRLQVNNPNSVNGSI
jgi:hypothetical protein